MYMILLLIEWSECLFKKKGPEKENEINKLNNS